MESEKFYGAINNGVDRIIRELFPAWVRGSAMAKKPRAVDIILEEIEKHRNAEDV